MHYLLSFTQSTFVSETLVYPTRYSSLMRNHLIPGIKMMTAGVILQRGNALATIATTKSFLHHPCSPDIVTTLGDIGRDGKFFIE
ncbi:hypothetical protein CEXT_193601 [Caerostris extrusa]|uniref:Uncharacterized protein n=1 Tax=Caerostris extrusa TaxID=172846 RepID=A0AAV4SWH8_CAEEX|nr:hypothetical protein CEXT_193601 [Caerostris extrusa]